MLVDQLLSPRRSNPVVAGALAFLGLRPGRSDPAFGLEPIKRWIKRRKETGDVESRAIPGRPSRKGVMLEEWLPKHLQANDDLTLEEHREAFEEEFGEAVSTSTVGRAISGLPDGGWPLKKSHR